RNCIGVSSGIRHSNVVAFINEKMARHTKGPEFYLENISLSWEEVEDKLWAILEDSEVPSEVKEACTWGSLALGVRFAHRQGQLQNRRVQWLQGFAKLHRSAAMVLASNLTELKEQQEMECNKATFQLRITQTSLAEAQRERDMLRWKLLHAVRSPEWPLPNAPHISSFVAPLWRSRKLAIFYFQVQSAGSAISSNLIFTCKYLRVYSKVQLTSGL
uniref:Testis-expressed protein 13 A-D N-terminal domain-containing protein n=1 Tax=Theropithecus gelada TaxID=9565 RepID=A0A8D2FCD8_THEGE